MKTGSEGESEVDDSPRVLMPMTIAAVSRDIDVPDIVIADPPGIKVVPAIENPAGFGVRV